MMKGHGNMRRSTNIRIMDEILLCSMTSCIIVSQHVRKHTDTQIGLVFIDTKLKRALA